MATATKVAFLTPAIRGGGAGWSLYYFLKHLDRTRIEPIVVTPDGEHFRDLDLEVVVPPLLHHREDEQRFGSKNAVSLAASVALNVFDHARVVPWVARLVRERGVQVIYCNSYMVEPIGALAAQLSGVRCVLHARNIHDHAAESAFFGGVAALPSVHRVVANSRASAKPYGWAASRKLLVIHNGVDLSEYARERVPRGQLRERLGLSGDALVVGFTGNIIPRKGVDTLVRAMARLAPRVPEAVLVVVGQVPVNATVDHRAECQALAETLGVADRVLFAGFQLDVRPAVVDFDVLALPSRQEPFGRSIIEAMALGTPVVATRVGGIPEIIEDGVHGLTVPPGDDESLASALESMLSDRRLRERYASAALAHVRTHFDVVALSRELEGVLVRAATPGVEA